jgi:flagellar hook-length control protein FliK
VKGGENMVRAIQLVPLTSSGVATGRELDPSTVDGAAFASELSRAQARRTAAGLAEQPTTDLPDPWESLALDPLGAALRAAVTRGEATDVVEGASTPETDDPMDSLEPSEPEGESLQTLELVLETLAASFGGAPAAAAPVLSLDSGLETGSERTDEQADAVALAGVPAPVAVAVDASPVPAEGLVELIPAELVPQAASPDSTLDQAMDAVAQAAGPHPQAEGSLPHAEGLLPETKAAQVVHLDLIAVPEQGTPEVDSATDGHPSSARTGSASARHQPVFRDLVNLITGAQAADLARHQGAHDGSTRPVVSAQGQANQPEAALPDRPVNIESLPAPVDQPVDGVKQPLLAQQPKLEAVPVPHPTPDAAPPARTTLPPEAILRQVSRSIRLLTVAAHTELRVRLHPADLGEIFVRLTLQDGVLKAHLQATDASVKAALDANLEALRARFDQQGLALSALEVSTGAGQLSDDGQHPSRRYSGPQPEGSAPQAPVDSEEGEVGEVIPQPLPVRRIFGRWSGSRSGGRVDHLA